MKHELYKGQVTLEFDEQSHVYKVDGKTIPSVTGILDIISKPALVPWVAKVCGEYLERNLKPGQEYDELEIKNMIGDMKRAHSRVKDDASTIGTLVHSWCERHIKAQLGAEESPQMPVNKQARKSIEAFQEWELARHVKYIDSESKIYSRQHRYAGTMDVDAEVDNIRSIGDLKTGNRIYKEMGLQLAGYQQAREEEGYGLYFTRWILRIGKDGEIEFQFFPNYANDLRGFLAALELYRWSKNELTSLDPTELVTQLTESLNLTHKESQNA